VKAASELSIPMLFSAVFLGYSCDVQDEEFKYCPNTEDLQLIT